MTRPASRRLRLRLLVVLLVPLVSVACGTDAGPTRAGDSEPAPATSTADAAGTDAGGTDDSGVGDSGVGDSGVGDSGVGDSGVGDPGAVPTLRPLTFMAGFSPQANLPFVGVYVADAMGFFADHGLDVEITHSAGGGEHLQLLTAGTVQVTTQDAAVLLERRADPGLPLVSLALLGQRGQQAFVALADAGMDSPKDWAGHTVGYKGTPPPDVYAILDAVGLDESDVDLVNVGFDPRVLTEGQVDVYPVFKSNEPDTLRGWGYELDQWEAADYDIPMLGLAYVSTEALVADRPEALDGFVDAAMEGIAWAQDHRDEAIDIVATWTGSEADLAHQRFILDTELDDATSPVTERYGPGWQTHDQWQDLADLLLDYDALPMPVTVDDAFTTQFLE